MYEWLNWPSSTTAPKARNIEFLGPGAFQFMLVSGRGGNEKSTDFGKYLAVSTKILNQRTVEPVRNHQLIINDQVCACHTKSNEPSHSNHRNRNSSSR